MKLTSPAFQDAGPIPGEHTCEGGDRIPELRIEGAPSDTRSFALICDDPDAPMKGSFVHWVIYGLAGDTTRIDADSARTAREGRNGFGRSGYGGPCPPKGHGRHRYFFKLFALDTELVDLPPGVSAGELTTAIKGHVIGEAMLMGTYERR